MSVFLVSITLLYHLHLTSTSLLTQVGRLYLPHPVTTDGTESIAIDTTNSFIFSANGDLLTVDVISFTATHHFLENNNIPMTLIKQIYIESAISDFDGTSIDQITSVTYSERNQLIYALAAPTNVATEFGYLLEIDTFKLEITRIKKLTDCFLPDQLTTTSDAEWIIIACEGEPDDNEIENPLINPPGSIAMVKTSNFRVYNVNFNEFNENGKKQLPNGIYKPYKSEPFSINVEPECIVIDDKDKYAYITLQENNGIAVLDIDDKEIINIFSLGYNDYSLYGLDASDKDGKINIQTYPNLYGLRMPDVIDFLKTKDGKQYILTANEGDSKEFDESRVGKVTLNPEAFVGYDLNELQNDQNLGRLKIVNQLGLNNMNQFNELFAFNSRDFTIWEIKTDSIELVYSSLNEFELITEEYFGQNNLNGFNSNYNNPSFDTRSDDKGIEPEAIVVGKCKDYTGKRWIYSFIGLERDSGIMVYDITDIKNSKFVQYLNNRNFDIMYPEKTRPPDTAGDVAPEQLRFIHQDVYGVPLLFAAFTESSSISIYTVNCGCNVQSGDCGTYWGLNS